MAAGLRLDLQKQSEQQMVVVRIEAGKKPVQLAGVDRWRTGPVALALQVSRVHQLFELALERHRQGRLAEVDRLTTASMEPGIKAGNG